MLGELRDVVEDELVRVSGGVVVVLVLVVGNGTNNSGVSVLKRGVSSELGTFLLIWVFFSHCAMFCL